MTDPDKNVSERESMSTNALTTAPNALSTLQEMREAAKIVAPIFGMKEDEVVVLFLLAQAEGVHPMMSLRTHHIIEGKPSMRADAMQAKFQQRGGMIEWKKFDAIEAVAMFSHPKLQPTPIEFSLTREDIDQREISLSWKRDNANKWQSFEKDNWKKHGAAMLRARVISAGVRMVDPGTVVGLYTPEEIEDMEAEAARQVRGEVVPDTTAAVRREIVKAPKEAEVKTVDAVLVKEEPKATETKAPACRITNAAGLIGEAQRLVDAVGQEQAYEILHGICKAYGVKMIQSTPAEKWPDLCDRIDAAMGIDTTIGSK